MNNSKHPRLPFSEAATIPSPRSVLSSAPDLMSRFGALAELVSTGQTVTVGTNHGPLVCMSQSTYARLLAVAAETTVPLNDGPPPACQSIGAADPASIATRFTAPVAGPPTGLREETWAHGTTHLNTTSPGAPSSTMRHASPSQPRPPLDLEAELAVHLTGRERQLLLAVSGGRTMAAVADELGLATNTVAQHLVSVRRKFRVTSTTAAVDSARRRGLL